MPKRKSTRNAQGAGTIRQRKDGKWEARYTIGRHPGTGRQIQKSVYGKTEQEVRKKLTQVTAAIDAGVYTAPSKMTVGQWLDIWLAEYVKGVVKPSTLYSYEMQCRNHVKPALGAVKLSALSAHTIQALYNKLHRESGLSAKTVKNIHGILHKALKQAVLLGYIKVNPTDACVLPRVVKQEIKPLDEANIAAFLKAIKGHKYETLYLVTLFTGMRQGEVLGLKWDSIDFKNKTLLIHQQLQRDKTKGGGCYFAPLKNDKSRLISPPPFILDALREHRRQQLEMRLRAGELWENQDLVFTNEIGGHLIHQSVHRAFKKIVTPLGLPAARFHDLRHTYAAAALQAGDDVKTVQDNLGHHTAAFTLDVYGHVTDKMKQDSANRMQRFYEEVKSG